MNIYVGNFPYNIGEDDIRTAFEAFGQVTSVSVIKDRYSGESRGFGFVEMANDDEGHASIEGLNGSDLGGRKLTVNEARPRTEGGGGGGRGGGGGGRGGDRRGGGGGGDRY